MRRHLLIGRLGVGDRETVSNAPDETVTDLAFVAARRRLDHGIGQAVEDLRRLGVFPNEVGLDLLVLAAHVYAADTRLSRSTESQDSWTREIRLIVPVSAPHVWVAATPVLKRMLNFLTGDRWEIGFRSRPRGFETVCPTRPRNARPVPFDSVGLFSGGLDSLIGAIAVLEDGHRPLLISHAGDGATSDAQEACFKGLRAAYPKVDMARLRMWMAFRKHLFRGVESEDTTRGRSFLFIALGLFAGTGLGTEFVLRTPENGFIALNVPLDPLRVGAWSTRTTHPFYLARWNELLRLVGIPGTVTNPYANKTKGEMIRSCANPDLLESLLPRAMSCASPTKGRWQKRGTEHCGYCLPCIIRRAAVAVAKGADPTSYTLADLHAGNIDTRKAHGRQIRAFQFAIERLRSNPRLAGYLILMPGPLAEESPEQRKAWADVYRRGMQEVADLLEGVVTAPV